MEDTNVQIPESMEEIAYLKVSVVLVDGELMPDSVIVTHADLTVDGWNILMEAYDDVELKLEQTAIAIQTELEREAGGTKDE